MKEGKTDKSRGERTKERKGEKWKYGFIYTKCKAVISVSSDPNWKSKMCITYGAIVKIVGTKATSAMCAFLFFFP